MNIPDLYSLVCKFQCFSVQSRLSSFEAFVVPISASFLFFRFIWHFFMTSLLLLMNGDWDLRKIAFKSKILVETIEIMKHTNLKRKFNSATTSPGIFDLKSFWLSVLFSFWSSPHCGRFLPASNLWGFDSGISIDGGGGGGAFGAGNNAKKPFNAPTIRWWECSWSDACLISLEFHWA